MSFEFKPVELGPEGKREKRNERRKHVRKTVIYMVIGTILSIIYTYYKEGANLATLSNDEMTNAAFIGAFMGFFITNSPCSRGKC